MSRSRYIVDGTQCKAYFLGTASNKLLDLPHDYTVQISKGKCLIHQKKKRN